MIEWHLRGTLGSLVPRSSWLAMQNTKVDLWQFGGVVGGRGVERVTGIEPAFSAWEADVLPLNYTRGRGDRSASP
jgi:hypothetical protein